MNKKQAFMYLATLQQGGDTPSEATWHTVFDVATGSSTLYFGARDTNGVKLSALPTNAQQLRISGRMSGATAVGGGMVMVYIYDGVNFNAVQQLYLSGGNKKQSTDLTEVLFDHAELFIQNSSGTRNECTLQWNKTDGTLEIINSSSTGGITGTIYANLNISKIEAYY